MGGISNWKKETICYAIFEQSTKIHGTDRPEIIILFFYSISFYTYFIHIFDEQVIMHLPYNFNNLLNYLLINTRF